jgi:hypothetical protein
MFEAVPTLKSSLGPEIFNLTPSTEQCVAVDLVANTSSWDNQGQANDEQLIEYTGMLMEEIAENNHHQEGLSQTRYFFKQLNGEEIELSPRYGQVLSLAKLAGQEVKIKSKVNTAILRVLNGGHLENQKMGFSSVQPSGFSTRSLMAVRNIKLLLVLADFDNVNTSGHISLQTAQDYMTEIARFYDSVSYGQINFDIDGDGDGSPDVAIASIPGETLKCGTSFYRYRGNTATNTPGFNDYFESHDVDDYTHIQVITNQGAGTPSCGYAGVARRPGGYSHIMVSPQTNFYKAVRVGVHELGHNFGEMHGGFDLNFDGKLGGTGNSQTDIAEVYGDKTTNMGSGTNQTMFFNTVTSMRLGLFDNHPQSIQTITSSGTYELVPLADEDNTSGVKILELGGPLQPHKLSIAYRYRIGEDSSLVNEFADSVIVYDGIVRQNGTGYGTNGSILHRSLNESEIGEVYTHQASGTTIKLISMTPQTANVEVVFPTGNSGGATSGGASSGGPTSSTTSGGGATGGGLACIKDDPEIVFIEGERLEGTTIIETVFQVSNNDQNCEDINLNLFPALKESTVPQQGTALSLSSGESKIITLKVNLGQLAAAEQNLELDLDISGDKSGLINYNLSYNPNCP